MQTQFWTESRKVREPHSLFLLSFAFHADWAQKVAVKGMLFTMWNPIVTSHPAAAAAAACCCCALLLCNCSPLAKKSASPKTRPSERRLLQRGPSKKKLGCNYSKIALQQLNCICETAMQHGKFLLSQGCFQKVAMLLCGKLRCNILSVALQRTRCCIGGTWRFPASFLQGPRLVTHALDFVMRMLPLHLAYSMQSCVCVFMWRSANVLQ